MVSGPSTGVVAIFIPIVLRIASATGRSPSRNAANVRVRYRFAEGRDFFLVVDQVRGVAAEDPALLQGGSMGRVVRCDGPDRAVPQSERLVGRSRRRERRHACRSGNLDRCDVRRRQRVDADQTEEVS